ncbi:hypothetical protein BJ508DRAFT_324834 [Ascobolus immersus RN42]|uniref:Uncharacterized protein n=1 Tax=Ascobolus immersus RN42 TaxID=1160509 RepID=A0A3N4IAY5_ASCIM|nr:hypothetical protein BJ508DRAFT_324834 [Ascobolus immersus RN42]
MAGWMGNGFGNSFNNGLTGEVFQSQNINAATHMSHRPVESTVVRPLRIVAICRAVQRLADMMLLADFLLFLKLFEGQPNIVNGGQQWYMQDDPTERARAFGGVIHGKFTENRIRIDEDFIERCMQECKLQILSHTTPQPRKHAVLNALRMATLDMEDRDGDVLFIASAHGLGTADSHFKGEILLDASTPQDPNCRISRSEIEAAVNFSGRTRARVTVISTSCYAGYLLSDSYNLVASSNYGSACSLQRSHSNRYRGTAFGSALDKAIRSEFGPVSGSISRISYLTADGLWVLLKRLMEEELPQETLPDIMKANPCVAPSGSAAHARFSGIQIPPRPVHPPEPHIPAGASQYTGTSPYASFLGNLLNPEIPLPMFIVEVNAVLDDWLQQHSVPTRSLTDDNIRVLITDYIQNVKESCEDQQEWNEHVEFMVRNESTETLRDHLVWWKWWKCRIAKLMETHKVKPVAAMFTLDDVNAFIDVHRSLSSLLPKGPLHLPSDHLGYDVDHVASLDAVLKKVEMAKVKNWLRETKCNFAEDKARGRLLQMP